MPAFRRDEARVMGGGVRRGSTDEFCGHQVGAWLDQVARTAVFSLIVLALAGLLAGPVAGSTAPGSVVHRKVGGPTTLWRAFPLGEQRARPPSSTRATAPATALIRPGTTTRKPQAGLLHVFQYALAVGSILLDSALLIVLVGPARRARASLKGALAPRRFRPVPVSRSVPSYVLAAPAGDGYVSVVHCEGEPPRVGELISYTEFAPRRLFVVVSVGRSPFPGDGTPCAFLLPV